MKCQNDAPVASDRSSGKPPRPTWRPRPVALASWLVCLALVAALVLSGCRKNELEKTADAPAPKVEGDTITFPTNSPQLASISSQPAEARTNSLEHLTGRLYWDDDKTVRVFTPVAGRVTAIRADLGDAITNGAPLAEIDSPDFNQAQANARTAAGNLAAAEKAFTRSKELLDHGAAAQKDVEGAEAAFIAAQAERNRAVSVLANYGGNEQSSNSIYILRSHLAGVLVEKNINPGQELRADLMLANAPNLFAPNFVISDPTTLWLQLDVPEAGLAALQPGRPLRVFAPGALPGQVFSGTIDKIADALDPLTRTVRVRGVVNNPDKLLKAEMYVQVDVVTDVARLGQAGVEVPSTALFMKGVDSFVFIEESSGRYHRLRVKTGEEKDNKVPILDGINPGQKVVTEGALLLQSLLEPAS